MSTEESKPTDSSRTNPRLSTTDRRRGRSRSPSAYLKKKGGSIRGFLSKKKKKQKKSASMISRSDSGAQSPDSSVATRSRSFAAVSDDDKVTTTVKQNTDAALKPPSKEISEVSKEGAQDGGIMPRVTSVQSFDEEETVYNVVVDTKEASTVPSVNTTQSKEDGGKGKILVVLLLIEPASRRFELLQLEFDPIKALVQDILAQIPVSVTEEILRAQEYTGICNGKGEEMSDGSKLKEFLKGGSTMEIALAIPKGRNGKECAILAEPVLTDPEVMTMIQPNTDNKDVSSVVKPQPPDAVKEKVVAAKETVEDVSAQKAAAKVEETVVPAKERASSIKADTPAAKDAADAGKDTTAKAAAKTAMVKAAEPKVEEKEMKTPKEEEPEITPKESPTDLSSKEVLRVSIDGSVEKDEKKIATILAGENPAQVIRTLDEETGNSARRRAAKKKASPGWGPFMIVFVFSSFFPLLRFHNAISERLRPGDNLTVGRWRGKCGILRYFPSQFNLGCEEETLIVEEGGVLTLYKGRNKWDEILAKWKGEEEEEKLILWQMIPQKPKKKKKFAKGVQDEITVTEVLHVEDYGGKISFGGRPSKLTLVAARAGAGLSPWPFVSEPLAVEGDL
mmetsp:Transcript_34208/g.50293  ORF Transcript_34208/g.50293 Transcript_34208/m.50293 type:complete len:620 (-) Transcript_34208:458-2317(-)|eukprot:CAMPEP_0195523934 /NCGR_PEP_ID=MMETSP0794_2-20130614/23447_1 /TAXON_ID=515487 /ORGANISM="Stephanopyxis turris, Strain CCMP 815" /LENGTH=619 /DNA_ID=CAMNT_0040654039 /DNA_START=75 /DNA_END=1934 /DNA_ORIENTATION=+